MTTAIQEAAQFYREHGLDLAKDIEQHLKFGVVISTPERFIIGHEFRHDETPFKWLPRGTGDGWYVHFAVGRGAMRWFIEHAAPWPLPYIGWCRFKESDRTRVHVHETARFLAKLRAAQ